MPICLKCKFQDSVKNGTHHGRQRYRCEQCRYQCTRGTARGRLA